MCTDISQPYSLTLLLRMQIYGYYRLLMSQMCNKDVKSAAVYEAKLIVLQNDLGKDKFRFNQI